MPQSDATECHRVMPQSAHGLIHHQQQQAATRPHLGKPSDTHHQQSPRLQVLTHADMLEALKQGMLLNEYVRVATQHRRVPRGHTFSGWSPTSNKQPHRPHRVKPSTYTIIGLACLRSTHTQPLHKNSKQAVPLTECGRAATQHHDVMITGCT
jgi:hypothetical protein